MTFNQRCKEQGYCTCKTYNCLIYGIRELEAQLAEIKDICESRLGSFHYTDAISDIHRIAIGRKGDE